MFFTAFVLSISRTFRLFKTQNRRPKNVNRKPPHKLTKLIKILSYPGLAYLGFEKPSPVVPCLGLAKYIY